jgi:hypothetical protein
VGRNDRATFFESGHESSRVRHCLVCHFGGVFRSRVHHQEGSALSQAAVEGAETLLGGIHVLRRRMDLDDATALLGTALQLLDGIAAPWIDRRAGNEQT